MKVVVMKSYSRFTNRYNHFLLIGSFILLSINCGVVDDIVGRVASTNATVEPTATRTPWPTFTPTATIDITKLAPTVTNTPPPSATPTPPPPPTATEAPPPTATPVPPHPKANVTATLNVRTGPSTAYSRLGQVTNGYTSEIFGRNSDSGWILINYSGGQGWVSAAYAQIEGDINTVEVVQVEPPSQPQAQPKPTPVPQQAANPAPPAPAGPSYRYKLTNMFGERNEGITQIRGYIKDRNGNPANGLRIRVRIGTFCTVAVPSGAPGVYPSGNYDVLLRPHASDGVWHVAIVDRPTNPNDNKCDPAAQLLSEEVQAVTNTKEGVAYVEFQEQ